MHRGLKAKGILVFGADAEESEIARDYLKKYSYALPSLMDRKEEAVKLYHIESWPTTVAYRANRSRTQGGVLRVRL